MSFWIPTASDNDSKSFTVAGGILESAAPVRVMIMVNRDMIGLCNRCFSSGVSVILSEDISEALCDKCKNA